MQDSLRSRLKLAGRGAAVIGLGLFAVVVVVRAPTLYEGAADAQALPAVTVTGVVSNHSSARIFYQPVSGARDYRVYDVANASDVKYAGLVHLTASANCPGSACLNHFVMQPDGVTPAFPYRVASGGGGGLQVLDVPATDIEWNPLGDGKPHSLVIEAVNVLGPVPKSSLYTGLQTVPLVSPLPAGAMLGMNKGHTSDGKVSTNGQGPHTNAPQAIARSPQFVVQANQSAKAIPSRGDASQTFFDTFENAENATIKLLARQDSGTDTVGNLGSMTYSMNAGSSREWKLEFRQTDNANSMAFVSSDHFMDILFDGATPGGSAPTHTIYGSMSMTPAQTVRIAGGQVVHLTMEVDAHQSFRRWVAFDLAPATDPLQGWDPNNHAISNSNRGIFVEIRDGGCTFDIFTGTKSGSSIATGTAGGTTHGARLWGQPGATGGAPIMCDLAQMYSPGQFSKNGLGLDDRSKFDFYLSPTHAALLEDGRLVVQSDIPAGSFPWSDQPLKVYYSHYLYHSDADIAELENFTVNGAGLCYPLNSYWFNEPTTGTAANQNVCGLSYPPGYGFPHSDERHWDNMGFEVLPAAAVPPGDFASLAASVQPPQILAPRLGAAASGMPSPTPTPPPAAEPTSLSGQVGQWINVTPANVNLTAALGCGNFGTQSVVADPAAPTDLYAQFNCQGIWKSTDYGQTWSGPINTGPGGAAVGDSAGAIVVAPGGVGNPPILYSAGIRGSGTGLWRSLDGGVSWTNFPITPGGARQDWYPPSVDPYDANHLIMAAHEQNLLAQSSDGGQTWASISMAGGMNENGGTAGIFFIDTGDATSTHNTWLYMAQGTGGSVGTWRTSNAGANWNRVDKNEHPHGNAQIYQPDTSGVVYMAGVYSAGGWGVQRSTDYGQTWMHVGASVAEAIVFGTPNNVYSMYGWACGIGCTVAPTLQLAMQPGATGWTTTATPTSMVQGPANAAVVFDGIHYVVVTANWTNGLWQYVEPGSNSSPDLARQPTSTSARTPPTNPGSGSGGSNPDSGRNNPGYGGSNASGASASGPSAGAGGAGGGAANSEGGANTPVAQVALNPNPGMAPNQARAQPPALAVDTPVGLGLANSLSLMSIVVDSSGGQLLNDRLSVSVHANAVADSGANLTILEIDSAGLPPPSDGFVLGSNAFLVTLTDSTGNQLSQVAVPLSLAYLLSPSDVSMAGGDLSRLKLVSWNGNAWDALACSAGDGVLNCTVPHLSLFALIAAPLPSETLDVALSNGWFYKEANGFNGSGERGYAVVDDDAANLWSEFQRLGGVQQLGYPVTTRFEFNGMITQAFQGGAIQWQPETGQAIPVDIMDELSARGVDSWLDAAHEVPPNQPDPAVGLAIFSEYPALGDFYSSDPNATSTYGAPVAAKAYGPLVAVRLQRAVLQYWTTDTPWAAAGTIAVASIGDLAKEAGMWPRGATTPAPPPLSAPENQEEATPVAGPAE